MSRLAAEYGISGNGIAKICDRLNIPYPPRGHWAKKAAGQKVVQYRLPEPRREYAERRDDLADAAPSSAPAIAESG